MNFTKIITIVILIVSFVAGIYLADIFFNGFRIMPNQDNEIKKGENRDPQASPAASPDGKSGTPTPSPSVTSKIPTPNPIEKNVLLEVPFTSQAPFGNWQDPKEQDGCEEASAIMAMAWVKSETLTKSGALKEILAIADYEDKNYGSYHDTDAEDTAKRIFEGYFGYSNIEVRHNIGIEDIKQELFKGNLVIIPADGVVIDNPHYTPPGPTRHMLVIKGYDVAKKEFITNDPGTSYGEGYRYGENVIEGALFDYPTGYHEPITESRTAMIVVKR